MAEISLQIKDTTTTDSRHKYWIYQRKWVKFSKIVLQIGMDEEYSFIFNVASFNEHNSLKKYTLCN